MQIQQKQYKDVYGLLQQSGLTESRVFFQDLGVDGLPDSGEDSADVMYERGQQTLFDPAARDRESKQKHQQKVHNADEQYSRLLQLAIEAVRITQTTSPRNNAGMTQ